MPVSLLWIQSSPVPPHTCPACRSVADAVTNVSDEPMMRDPEPGDVSICGVCQTVSIFQADGQLRLATSAECDELPEWAKLSIASGEPKSRRRN